MIISKGIEIKGRHCFIDGCGDSYVLDIDTRKFEKTLDKCGTLYLVVRGCFNGRPTKHRPAILVQFDSDAAPR